MPGMFGLLFSYPFMASIKSKPSLTSGRACPFRRTKSGHDIISEFLSKKPVLTLCDKP